MGLVATKIISLVFSKFRKNFGNFREKIFKSKDRLILLKLSNFRDRIFRGKGRIVLLTILCGGTIIYYSITRKKPLPVPPDPVYFKKWGIVITRSELVWFGFGVYAGVLLGDLWWWLIRTGRLPWVHLNSHGTGYPIY